MGGGSWRGGVEISLSGVAAGGIIIALIEVGHLSPVVSEVWEGGGSRGLS